jgi:hypothetical protein
MLLMLALINKTAQIKNMLRRHNLKGFMLVNFPRSLFMIY